MRSDPVTQQHPPGRQEPDSHLESGGKSRVSLLGVEFDALSQHEAADQILCWAHAPREDARTIITVNVAILMMMATNPELRDAIAKADMVVADGMPLVWCSGWFGKRLPERVTGVDLMSTILERGDQQKLRVYMLGATPARLRALLDVVSSKYKGVEIVGARDGYFGPDEEEGVVAAIARARPDILLIGMPAPFKEIWSERRRASLGAATVLGVGGAFDVLAGAVPRAPKLMQRLGLEWTWRLAQEPRKLWKRYLLTNTQFAMLLVRELAGAKSRAGR